MTIEETVVLWRDGGMNRKPSEMGRWTTAGAGELNLRVFQLRGSRSRETQAGRKTPSLISGVFSVGLDENTP